MATLLFFTSTVGDIATTQPSPTVGRIGGLEKQTTSV
jgi:hypothetical protein